MQLQKSYKLLQRQCCCECSLVLYGYKRFFGNWMEREREREREIHVYIMPIQNRERERAREKEIRVSAQIS